jgi:hypothetical protein
MLFSSLLPAVSLLFPSAYAAGFTDVFQSTPYAASIEQLRADGIVQGYADGTFRPDHHMNRAEFTKMIVGISEPVDRMLTCPTEDLPFPDVTADAWYAPYVCVAWKFDWIRGYPDGTFGPSRTINFAEAAKIMVGDYFDNAYMAEHPPEGPWYQPYFEKLTEFNALPESYRSPSQLITRGEMAEMLLRVRMGRKAERMATPIPPSYFLQYHTVSDIHSYRKSGKITKYGDWDAELVVSDAQGDRVMIPSIKEALPELAFPWDRSLKQRHLGDGPELFFDVLMTPYALTWSTLYVLDPSTSALRKLSFGGMHEWMQDPIALSDIADPRYLAAIEKNGRTLHVLDLQKDVIAATVKVAEQETLLCGYTSQSNVSWDRGSFRYSVYRIDAQPICTGMDRYLSVP